MRELTIVQLNDLHGYLVEHPEWLWDAHALRYESMGGLARIKTVVDGIRSKEQYVLFADNGDTFHGTRAVVQSKGDCMLPLMKELGLHAMTGHWDFAYGPEHLVDLTHALPYPFLAANVYDCDTGKLVFPAVTKIDLGPIRVGVIGLACNIVDKTMPPHFSTGIRFTEGKEELPGYVKQLRESEHCDVIVLLSHLGLPQDLELLSHVTGVDVCLSAHTHNRLEKPIHCGSTIVIQSGCHGSFLGYLRLGIQQGHITLLEHKLIPITSEIPAHPKMAQLVTAALADSPSDALAVVGNTTEALHRATMLESPADNLLLRAMLAATGAKVAFINGWRYGAPIPAGPITRDAIYNFAPMNPEVSTVVLSGEEIWNMIEENLERTFSRHAFGQMGGYIKRCGGMKTYFKVENPASTRVQAIFIGDEPLQRDRDYAACYVTMQAVPQKYGHDRKETGRSLVDTVVTYLESGRAVFGKTDSFVEI